MRRFWQGEWPAWSLLAGMFVAGEVAWSRLPERVPVHWALDGTIERYGGRVEGVLLLPLLSLIIYILLRTLPRFDPGRANYAHFTRPYALIRSATLALLAAIYAVSLLVGLGYPLDMTRIVPVLVGGLLIVIGSVLGKLRPTWFVGICTPWTLSSARSWGKTHRLGGWAFIVAELLMVVGGLLGMPLISVVALAALGVAMLGLCAYSYVIWREDRGATPPTAA